LCRCRLSVVSEVEVREVRVPAVGSEFDGRLQGLVEHERVAVKGREAWGEHRSHELPHGGSQGVVSDGYRVGELAGQAFGADALVRVTPSFIDIILCV
jgi:hypothetical protein